MLDADFAAARAGVLDVAAFLDRVDRGEGEVDFRYHALMDVLPLLSASGPGRVRAILEALSYRDDTVPETAAAKAACGAPNLSK
ncbi:hypothetical protein C5O10_05475 [Akkermansia muciniphila]|nr:hypothetical protein C5O09_05440 [Akkermansia muciniphila]QHV16302.1 hypothetical protein C5O10_05475 [Akkermansia muciniphila]